MRARHGFKALLTASIPISLSMKSVAVISEP